MEIKDYDINKLNYNQITYTLFNMIEDDYFVQTCEKKYNEKYSVDDFIFAYLPLTDKEKFMIKMHNHTILNNISYLKKKYEDFSYIRIYIDYTIGEVLIIKLKDKIV